MNYREVMKLPLRTFWSFNRQVDRLRAEKDQRTFRLMNASQSPESAKALVQALNEELASPVLVEKKFDQAKFDEIAQRFARGA